MSRFKFWHGRSLILRQLATLLSGTAISQIILFCLTPVLGRIFTPADFGRIALFTAVAATVASVGAGRYDMAIMLPSDHNQARSLIRASFKILLYTSLATTLVCILAKNYIAFLYKDTVLAWWLVMSGLAVFLLGAISIYSYWFNRLANYQVIATNRITQVTATSFGQIGLGIINLLHTSALLIGNFIGMIVAVINFRRIDKKTKNILDHAKQDEVSSNTQLFACSKDLVSPQFWAFTQSEKWLLRRYCKMPLINAPNVLLDSFRINGTNALIGLIALGVIGQFQMAVRLVEAPIVLINGAVSQVFFQRFTTVPRGAMKAYLLKVTLVLATVQIFPFIILYLFSPILFPWFLGDQWQQSGYIAQAILPWIFLNAITSPISSLFVVVEKQQVALAFSFFYTLVPLSVLWFTPWGFITTIQVLALSMAICLVLYLGLALYVAHKYDKEIKDE